MAKSQRIHVNVLDSGSVNSFISKTSICRQIRAAQTFTRDIAAERGYGIRLLEALSKSTGYTFSLPIATLGVMSTKKQRAEALKEQLGELWHQKHCGSNWRLAASSKMLLKQRLARWTEVLNKGFDIDKKAFVSCTGVTLYLTNEAIADTLKKMTLLASGSTIAIAFYLPLDQLDEEDKPMQEIAIKGAAASGTPFVSFFRVEEIITLTNEIGFSEMKAISTTDLTASHFKSRTDDLFLQAENFFCSLKHENEPPTSY